MDIKEIVSGHGKNAELELYINHLLASEDEDFVRIVEPNLGENVDDDETLPQTLDPRVVKFIEKWNISLNRMALFHLGTKLL